jgi:two-component system response regulator YesN
VFADGEVEGYSEEQNRVTCEIEEMTDQMEAVLMIELGLEGWAFILKGMDDAELGQTEEEFLERLQLVIRTANSGIEYFGGVGCPVGRLSELNKCFEEANRAFAYRYLMARNQIIRSSDHPKSEDGDGEVKLSSLKVENLDRRIVERFLKTGTEGEISHFIEEYFASLGEKNVQSLMFRQYVAMDMYFAAVSMLESLGFQAETLVERCGDFKTMTKELSTLEQTSIYLGKVFAVVIELRENVSRKKYSSLLQDARTYINQNFDNEEISLNTVAASVNLSPNHFSTIFSQETGQTFIEYLTFVRMEKSKELLRGTSMKTAEIAYAVGYKDAHYFSYLFKKTQECTPREFRAKA